MNVGCCLRKRSWWRIRRSKEERTISRRNSGSLLKQSFVRAAVKNRLTNARLMFKEKSSSSEGSFSSFKTSNHRWNNVRRADLIVSSESTAFMSLNVRMFERKLCDDKEKCIARPMTIVDSREKTPQVMANAQQQSNNNIWIFLTLKQMFLSTQPRTCAALLLQRRKTNLSYSSARDTFNRSSSSIGSKTEGTGSHYSLYDFRQNWKRKGLPRIWSCQYNPRNTDDHVWIRLRFHARWYDCARCKALITTHSCIMTASLTTERANCFPRPAELT